MPACILGIIFQMCLLDIVVDYHGLKQAFSLLGDFMQQDFVFISNKIDLPLHVPE